MIARTWRGSTKLQDADTYVDYLARTGFRELRATPGNRGVFGLRRTSPEKAEFIVLSLWESLESIHGFAGEDIARAVFYPEDEAFLIEKDDHVDHFEVVFQEPGPV